MLSGHALMWFSFLLKKRHIQAILYGFIPWRMATALLLLLDAMPG